MNTNPFESYDSYEIYVKSKDIIKNQYQSDDMLSLKNVFGLKTLIVLASGFTGAALAFILNKSLDWD